MTQQNDEPLLRQLTVTGIWLLAVNGFIGAGIFGSPAEVARLTGTWSPLLFAGCGLLMLTVILCFAEVSSYFKNTGGPILYARTVFGSFAGFQTGWAFYIARLTAFAANINLLVSTLGYFNDDIATGLSRIVIILVIVAVLAWINIAGTKRAMDSIGILTVLKFLPLLLLIAFGISFLDSSVLPQGISTLPDYTSAGTAALLVIYAFVGWEAAVIPAGETKNPSKTIPSALLLALLTVTLLYVGIQYVALATVPDLASSTRPLVEAADAIMGPIGALLLTAGIVVSVGGNIAGTVITTPRITYALARENSLPAWFANVHETYRTPNHSILFFAVVAFLLSIYGSFVWLAAMSALVRILIYIICVICIPWLRKNKVSETSFQLPGGLAIPIVAVVVCLWLLSAVSLASWTPTLLFLSIGTVLYFGVKKIKSF
jgi:amino acid transporter